MAVLDRFAKRFGYTKMRQRRPIVKRSFDGGKLNRLLTGSGLSSENINTDLETHLSTLTQRARHLSKNDDYVRRFIQLVKQNVVGHHGLVLRGQIIDDNRTADTRANEAVEEAFKEWGMTGSPDVTGKLSWIELQNLAIEHIARDGEFLAKKITTSDGFKLQVLDPMYLDASVSLKPKGKQNAIILGVEVDQNYRPLAYHFRVNGTAATWRYQGKALQRIPANEIIHIFRPSFAEQVRGFTPMASAISRLSMVNGFEEAALVAARIGASKMGFYIPGDDAAGQYEGDDLDADGNLIDEVEPGVFSTLPRGYDVKEFKADYPNISYSDFISSVLKGISAGLGVSYPSLSGDLSGVNFSSIRTAVLEDREAWKDMQSWLTESLCRPVFEIWLKDALARGIISTGGNAIGLSRFDKFKRVTFQARRWAWVDPLKDMNANKVAIDNRIRSTSDVIREQGQDPDEVFAEIARERAQMDALGIKPMEAVQRALDLNEID